MENPRIDALKQRMDNNVYIRHWQVPLTKACCARPGYCCFAMWCAQCSSYELRKQALYGDMTRYICCNGGCPCSGRMGEKSCPGFCLCLEVFCCFAQSVASTRWMIQDEMRVETTPCDQCIIGTMIALQYIACVCHIIACITGNDDIAAIANLIDCLADIVWCTVCACMQTQHKVELDARDKNPGAIPPPAPGQAPAVQMIPQPGAPPQRAYAPPAGYPAPGAPPPGYAQYPPPPPGYGYGAPPPGAPPPGYAYPPPPPGYPQQGYPPQGYPPQGYPPQGYAPGQPQMQK